MSVKLATMAAQQFYARKNWTLISSLLSLDLRKKTYLLDTIRIYATRFAV